MYIEKLITKILLNSKITNADNGSIQVKNNCYEGLTVEESKFIMDRGGINKCMEDIIKDTIDNNYSIINDVLTNLKSVKEVLEQILINQEDKNRTIKCYSKVKTHYDLYNELPEWGNISIHYSNKTYIYKVYYDKSIEYLQTYNNNEYKELRINFE